jgi:hypothetical protein
MKKGKNLKINIDELPLTQSLSHIIVNIKDKDDCNVDLPGYECIECNLNKTKKKSVCWNCCHEIPGNILFKPIKYENNVFQVLGNFCSYPCIARYIMDSNNSSDIIFSDLSILNLYVNTMCKDSNYKINPAPPRLTLSMFGGNLDIDEYRKYNETYLTTVNVEPIVSFIDISTKNLPFKNNNIVETKKEFKLYRKNKKINDNDIYTSMNLISE